MATLSYCYIAGCIIRVIYVDQVWESLEDKILAILLAGLQLLSE